MNREFPPLRPGLSILSHLFFPAGASVPDNKDPDLFGVGQAVGTGGMTGLA